MLDRYRTSQVKMLDSHICSLPPRSKHLTERASAEVLFDLQNSSVIET